MDVTIIVVSFNTRHLLESSLVSTRTQFSGISHEVIVVDNASEDGSAELVAREFPDVILIRNRENRGFACAVNQAIRASCGRYLLLLNSDATLLEGAVQSMVTDLDTHPRAGATGGRLVNPDGSFQGSYADFPTLIGELLLLTGLSRWLLPPTFPSHTERESQDRRVVDWVCGAFLMIRRAALEDVGLLDEDYFMYAEEVDWCHRARRRGWSVVYLPDAQAVHVVGASYGRAPARRRAQIYRSKQLYFRKNHGHVRAALFGGLVKACSAVKLGAWALAAASYDASRRDLARRNVASYCYLLSHF
jgi:N-acetylglucosaminyl-diphospho-decaprenol L-rhamnosyltransferase